MEQVIKQLSEALAKAKNIQEVGNIGVALCSQAAQMEGLSDAQKQQIEQEKNKIVENLTKLQEVCQSL